MVPNTLLSQKCMAVARSDDAIRSRRQTAAFKIVAMKLSGRDLVCVRGGRRVFSGVCFSVAAGQALVLTGPNGAGKSSLLRMIAGLIHPVAGSVVLEGGDPELSVGEQAHYVGHLDPLKPALTVMENLAFWARFLNGSRAADETDAVARSLAAVGLEDLSGLPAGYLSAGQRRRLSLARVMAAPRPVWLLDEPTTALDAASQQRLQGAMQAHLDGGGLIVAATHAPLGLAAPVPLELGARPHRGDDDFPSPDPWLDPVDAAFLDDWQ
jgi:heme exporter protein A